MISTNSSSNGKSGCITTTSECVIWQGPNIDCIDLCTGDTISTVIATLAQELCDLIESVQVSGNVACIKDWAGENNYDLSHHDLATLSDGTASIQDHFNLMYEMICAALACCGKEDIPPDRPPDHDDHHQEMEMPSGTSQTGLAEMDTALYNDLINNGAQIDILTGGD